MPAVDGGSDGGDELPPARVDGGRLHGREDFAADRLVALADALTVGVDVIRSPCGKSSQAGPVKRVGRFGELDLWPPSNPSRAGVPMTDQGPVLGAFHLSEARISPIGLEGLDMAVANIWQLNALGREEAEEGRQHVPGITVLDLLQERPVTRIHGRFAPRVGHLSVEPEERRPRVGAVIDEGLGVHPKPGRVEFLHRRADRRDPGRDQGERPIKVPSHLAQRRRPMALLGRRKLLSLLDRGMASAKEGSPISVPTIFDGRSTTFIRRASSFLSLP